METLDFKGVVWALTGDTAVRPVDDTLTIAERILELKLLDRMSDKPDGRVGRKPTRIDRVVTRIRVADDMPAQERKNRDAGDSRVQGDTGEPLRLDLTPRFLAHFPDERTDQVLALLDLTAWQLPTRVGGLDEENPSIPIAHHR